MPKMGNKEKRLNGQRKCCFKVNIAIRSLIVAKFLILFCTTAENEPSATLYFLYA